MSSSTSSAYDAPVGYYSSSICQLGEGDYYQPSVAGGLVSEFISNVPFEEDTYDAISDSRNYGTAYLVVNITSGYVDATALSSGQLRPSVRKPRDEWLDMIYQYDTSNGASSFLNLSVTLCYSAFDTADIYLFRSQAQPTAPRSLRSTISIPVRRTISRTTAAARAQAVSTSKRRYLLRRGLPDPDCNNHSS